MKQLGKIFKYELKGYLQNKIFVGITVFLVALIAVVMFFPRIGEAIGSEEEEIAKEDLPIMLVLGENEAETEMIRAAFTEAFPDYTVTAATGDADALKEQITRGGAECAFVIKGFTDCTYYVNNLSMYDVNASVAAEVLQSLYRMSAMVGGGMSPEDAAGILSVSILPKTENLGVDQMENFFYTYIMIFALYMVILLYGQMVATNVATEKSSRAMELLITSANPVSMMFGKVFASCAAGLLQLVAVFGSALICFRLNASYWENNAIVRSIFDMPIELFVYMLIFFVLGFLIYAFLFGAIGSTASKLEDINTSVMPVTVLFIIGFFVVVFSMTSGDVDNVLMRVCSYIPFTSPMAMFTRIAMTTVPFYEILISIVILVISVFGIGYLSAKIYRVGVLLYGTPPKIGAILKAIRHG